MEHSIVLLLAEDLRQDFDYLHDMEEKSLLEFKISQGLKVFTKYNYQLTIQDNLQQVEVPACDMWYQMVMFQQNPAIKNFMICSQNQHQLTLTNVEQLNTEGSQYVIFVYKAFDSREIVFTDRSILRMKEIPVQQTVHEFSKELNELV